MIQPPYDFGISEDNESSSAQEDFRSSKTPRHQGVESETSFDSGYFSPPVSTRTSHAYQRDSTLLPVYQQSPSKIGRTASTRAQTNENSPTGFHFGDDDGNVLPTDLPAILDDWDKNFIDNFQENLFGFDNIEDIGFIDNLLKSSPLKSPYKSRFLSPLKLRQFSPGKYQFSPDRGQLSPVLNRYSSSMTKTTSTTSLKSGSHKSGFTLAKSTSQPNCDKEVSRLHSPDKAESFIPSLSSKKFHMNFERRIKEEPEYATTSESTPLLPHENAYFEMDAPILSADRQSRILKATENYRHITPVVEVPQNTTAAFGAPPKKLQRVEPKRALAHNYEPRTICASKQKLQMARAHFKISLDRAIQTAASRQLATKSDRYPQLSKALTKKSAAAGSASQADITESSETATLPFERYRDSGSTAGSGYEVKRKSDCKVVIRKKSK